jgi:uncharacterized protein (DUF2235 family)
MALYAFDGTWNDRKDAGEYDKNTNVVRFVDHYGGTTEFFKGIGRRYGHVGKWIGGALGVGGRKRIHDASVRLFELYKEGDREIDIVGFSRGAALALHFSNKIYRRGIRHPDSGERIGDRHPAIRFLGLFDVVAAFGIPVNLGIPFQRINLGYRLRLPPNVEHCFHALALDERRSPFRATRVDNGYEVWFRGVHSDVGGGNQNLGLNNISFRWLVRKATAVGVPVSSEIADELPVDTGAAVKSKGGDKPRQPRPDDRVHYTVEPRVGKEHTNPPIESPRESENDELSRGSHSRS